MIFRRINRLVPEQVYISVVNNSDDYLTANHGVVWDQDLDTTPHEGYAVRFAHATTNTLREGPNAFAGVVDEDIGPRGRGLVQVWGIRNSVAVTGFQAAQIFLGASVPWAKWDLHRRMLRPVNLYATGTEHVGLFGVLEAVTNPAVVFSNVFVADKVLGGYVVPMSRMYTSVSDDGSYISGTLSVSGTGFCKVFIRAL